MMHDVTGQIPATMRAFDRLGELRLGFQEHLPENVRLGEMSDWRTIPSAVKTEV